MIIWINGPFGAGKTTVSGELKKALPDAVIFDPEHLGGLIHQTIPGSRETDFQNFPLWRKSVAHFIGGLHHEFNNDIIVPMTLVNCEYLNEIFTELRMTESIFFHFFLNIDRENLETRIKKQVLHPDDPARDTEVRQWRLDQIERCIAAKNQMPKETIFLESVKKPEVLVNEILEFVEF